MGAWIVVPAMLSLWMLGAHFLRMGSLVLVGVCLVLSVLVWVRNRWMLRAVQVVLVLGAVEWLCTLYGIVQERQAEGREWVRAAVILMTVAVVSVVSAGLLRWRSCGGKGSRRWEGEGAGSSTGGEAVGEETRVFGK